MTNPKLQINTKSKIINPKLRKLEFRYWNLFGICFLVFVIYPSAVLADGLVPCTGIDCSLCHLFSLVQNIFNFVVWTLVPIVATAIILWAGFDMITAGGNQNKAGAGRKRLTAVMIGIAIVYSSYILASFVVRFLAGDNSTANSSFKSGQFEISCTGGEIRDVTGDYLKGGSFDFKVGEDIALPEPPVTIVEEEVIESDYILGIKVANPDVNLSGLKLDVKSKLASAGATAEELGITIVATDGARTFDYQMSLAQKNCQDVTAQKCTPKAGRPLTCIPRGDGSNCRHIKGEAVDAWCWQNGSKCSQTSFFTNIMKPNGFCVLTKISNPENWHFELKSNLEKNPDRLAGFDCGAPN